MRGVLKAGLPLAAAITTALAADTVSITVMEIVDNAVILAAIDAHLGTVIFCATLALSPAVAFVLTTPINKWMIGRGNGHGRGARIARAPLSTRAVAEAGPLPVITRTRSSS